MSLQRQLAVRFLPALVVVGGLLFIPAGSFEFWQGWAYLAVWFVPGFLALAYFCKHDPELVERRLGSKEKVREQKLIMKAIYGTYLIAFLLPGFDHRFGWSHLPSWLTVLCRACLRAGHPVSRSPPPQRRTGSAPRAARLLRILPPHPLSPRSPSLVSPNLEMVGSTRH